MIPNNFVFSYFDRLYINNRIGYNIYGNIIKTVLNTLQSADLKAFLINTCTVNLYKSNRKLLTQIMECWVQRLKWACITCVNKDFLNDSPSQLNYMLNFQSSREKPTRPLGLHSSFLQCSICLSKWCFMSNIIVFLKLVIEKIFKEN